MSNFRWTGERSQSWIHTAKLGFDYLASWNYPSLAGQKANAYFMASDCKLNIQLRKHQKWAWRSCKFENACEAIFKHGDYCKLKYFRLKSSKKTTPKGHRLRNCKISSLNIKVNFHGSIIFVDHRNMNASKIFSCILVKYSPKSGNQSNLRSFSSVT